MPEDFSAFEVGQLAATAIDVAQSVLLIVEEATEQTLTFATMGNTSAADGALTVQPESLTIVPSSEGTMLLTFRAAHKKPAKSEDTFLHDDVRLFRELMNLAGLVKGGLSTRRVVVRTQRINDRLGYLESAVVSGSIKEIDGAIMTRWFDKDAMEYVVQIEVRPFAERAARSKLVKDIGCHGGIGDLGDVGDQGTAGGRIRSLVVRPDKTANYQWRTLWIGIKPNLTIDGELLSIYSQVKVSNETALPPELGETLTDPVLSDGVYIDGEGVRIPFTFDTMGWQTRFFVPSSRWTTNAGLYATHMPGMWRLLGRLQMPDPDDREAADPHWGVRARTVFDRGLVEGYELERLPEIILPDATVGDGPQPAYYELGNLTIGHDYYLESRSSLGALALASDVALLGMQQWYSDAIGDDEDAGRTGGTRADDSLRDTYWLGFDDYRLVPLDSFIRINLPKQITQTERLEVVFDDEDNPRAVVMLDQPAADEPTIQYVVTDIEVGPNGFTMPPYKNNQMVVVADSGPGVAISTSATIKSIELIIKPRELGGEV